MSVLQVRRVWGTTGTNKAETWHYLVIMSNDNATATQARTASGIPVDGTEYAPSTGVYSFATATQKTDCPWVWDVEVQWNLNDAQKDEKKPDGSGVKWNVKVSSKAHPVTLPVYNDDTDSAIVNSAGYAFSSQPTYTYYDEDITVSFNTDDGSIPAAISARRGLVSSDSITFTYNGTSFTFAAKHMRLTEGGWDVSYTKNEDGEPELFWNVTLTFWHRPFDEHHDIELADTGFYDKDGNEFLDKKTGQPKTTETMLDGTGSELPATTIFGDPTTCHPLQFEIYPTIAMMPLLTGI